MRRKLIIIPVLFLFVVSVFAQQKVTVRMEQQLLTDLFEVIEQQTNYRIYSLPADTDSLRISVNVVDEEVLTVLQQALERTSLKVSQYANSFFITDSELITSLPEGYFDRERAIETEGSDISGLSLSQRTQRASSENKVYEIGDPSANPTGRVNLSGTLIDFKTGEAVVGATLFIEEPMIGVTSDAYGYYTIQLPAGRHELNIRGMGLKDTRRQIVLHSDGKMDIELEEEVYALREVVIAGDRVQNVRRTTMGVERLQVRDIKNIPTAFGEVDVIKAVLLLPGVKSVGEASSGFNVRGGSTDQNLILFNDGTIYNPTHLFGFFSAFNSDLIRDMELYKSSIPAKYGGRISSVLDINTREGNKKEFGGSASIGLLTSSLTLEGPLFSDKTSYIIGGRTTYSDWILKQLPEDSGYRDGSAGFYDLNASINHKFSDYDNLSINGYFSNDRFRFTDEERYSYQNANASIKWRHIFNPKLTSTITAGYDHYDYDTKNTENAANAFSMAFDINQYFGKADFTWYVNDQHTLDFGMNGLLYNLNPGTYLPEGSESLVVEDRLQKEKAIESGIYVEDRWDILPGLSVNAGIRYSMFNVMGPRDYYTYQDEYIPSLSTVVDTVSVGGKAFKTYHGPEFRLSARYEFDNTFSIKAGFNTMRQNIHKISNTTVMSPTDTWKLSDANIKPQTGSQLALGLYKNFANNTIETSIEAYYKKMNDYLDYRNGAELLMNHHLETDVLNTEGRAYGVELMVKKTQGKLNGWISYTYSRTELRQNDPKVIDPVNNGDWYPADYDKPHDFKFVGNYKFTHRFSFSMNLDYSTGRPITLPVSKYNYAGGEYVYFSDRNKYRIPDFFRIDASINIEPSHNLTKLTHSSVSIGVYNLTGRKNAYSVYYIAEEGKLKGYKLAIFGVPIPYISYNIKF
ncbi:TonB-dependent receptor [Parabacteroides sp. OttesenSCG-928-G07]|nr:TonB-dependent receptor [Parabacteroides sp. OttesenSCG-928-G21]MDL2277799.1 TonB-dependent receptor [Parabacteroides sp. OttesenSCG-928-G07]